jgi:hypothetical protein
MNTATHTPTPWNVLAGETTIDANANGHHWIVADTLSDGLRDAETREIDAENAAFIVRACNEYDAREALVADLVAALREVMQALAAHIDVPLAACIGGPFQNARAALAKAGAA